jgi:DNA polymerase
MELTLTTLQERIKQWKGCPLAATANAVLGEGNPHAEVMFIGEAPGEQEDRLGRPFVGPAGKFLDELLTSIGLKREDVYISNVVKYRPPLNREPTEEEKEQCMPWLKLEIALIRPKVIVPLGRHALGHFFSKLSITSARGKPQKLTHSTSSRSGPEGPSGPRTAGQADGTTIFPIYHPAAALHNAALRQSLFDDFKALGAFLQTLHSSPTP